MGKRALHFVDTSTSETESEQTSGYSYFVKMINPKKKSDFVVRMWHDEHSQFKSPAELKIKLLDTFPEDISNTQDFQVGYFEPPGSTKRWISSNRDIVAMYTTFKPGSKINLWCDRKINSGDEEENDQPRKKKKKSLQSLQTDNERDLDEIFHDLKKKNPKMEAPKLRLWAKLIESGRYDSYEDPPAIPLITGGPLPGKPKKESLSDAVSGTPINHKIDDSSVSKISPK